MVLPELPAVFHFLAWLALPAAGIFLLLRLARWHRRARKELVERSAEEEAAALANQERAIKKALVGGDHPAS